MKKKETEKRYLIAMTVVAHMYQIVTCRIVTIIHLIALRIVIALPIVQVKRGEINVFSMDSMSSEFRTIN